MPPETVDFNSERLLVLTLALEAALVDSNYADAQALFKERSNLLGEIERSSGPRPASIRQVEEIGRRIESLMTERSRALARELQTAAKGKLAHKAYACGRAQITLPFQSL